MPVSATIPASRGRISTPGRADRRQFLGRRPRRPGLRAGDAGAGHAGDDRQHRLQAGHHHAARQPRLQCLQGRAEDLHRRAGARAAQRAGRENLRASADPRLHLHRHDRRRHDEAGRRVDRRAGRRLHAGIAWRAATSISSAPTTRPSARTDERRMAWAIGDIIENRPALSRWHPDYGKPSRTF